MLTSVKIQNGSGNSIDLAIDSFDNGYLLKNITGLDPVKASIVSTTIAQRDGAAYQTSRVDARNIIITLGYIPNYVTTSVQSLRGLLYVYAMPKTYVTLTFYIDYQPYATIGAYVESLETELFASDPEVTISLLAFEPYFKAYSETTISGISTENANNQLITYNGSVETGFVITLSPNRAIQEINLFNQTPDGSVSHFQSLLSSEMYASGSKVIINTIDGSKSIVYNASNSIKSKLYSVSPASRWVNLQPGANGFRVQLSGVGIPWSMKYRALYGGL